MSVKYICPFCHHKIEQIFEIKIVQYKKRKKIRTKHQKTFIGHDFDLHKKKCKEYNEFINNMK